MSPLCEDWGTSIEKKGNASVSGSLVIILCCLEQSRTLGFSIVEAPASPR